jgi:hypothetical protein
MDVEVPQNSYNDFTGIVLLFTCQRQDSGRRQMTASFPRGSKGFMLRRQAKVAD